MIRARGSGWRLSATLLLTSVLMRKPPGRETQPQWAALRAKHDDRYITVGEHFDCFATEHDRRDAATAMGGHHNCVASSLSRRIDNRLVGVLVFNLHHIAGHASRRGSILRPLEIFRGKSRNTFFVLVRRVRHHARLNRENMERLRYSYCGDFGIESFCQSNPMVDGFLRQLGSVARNQDMLVHFAPPSNFPNARSHTTADHRLAAAVLATPHVRYQATRNRSDGLRSTNESFSTQPSRPHTCPAR